MAYPVLSRAGSQFLGEQSPSHMEVHNLRSETKNCQTEEILRAGNGVGFLPDSLQQAHAEGYDNCVCCIGGSTR